jgi:hypothetical protein
LGVAEGAKDSHGGDDFDDGFHFGKGFTGFIRRTGTVGRGAGMNQNL